MKKALCCISFFAFMLSTQFCFAQWEQSGWIPGGSCGVVGVNGNYIFINTGGYNESPVYYTSNNGVNWIKTSLNDEISGFAFKDNNIYASALYGKIYHSTDLGVSWTVSNFPTMNILSITVSGSKIFASVTQGIYVSTDNCATWSQSLFVENGVSSLTAFGNNIFGNWEHGLVRSSNNGLNWTYQYFTNEYIGNFASLGNVLFMSAENTINGNGKLYKSTNFGLNWDSLSYNYGGFAIYSFGSNLLSAIMDSIYFSSNSGVSWTKIPTVFRSSGLTVMDNNILVPTVRGLYESSNLGVNWSQISPNKAIVNSLVSSGGYLFAGLSYDGVYTSSDNGTNWNKTSLENISVSAMTVNGNKIFAGTDQYYGVYFTTNNGTNWSLCPDTYTYAITSMASSGNNIFASGQTFILRSTNNGLNWSNISNHGTYYNTLYITGNNIFEGTENGLYRSTNNGSNWSLTSLSGSITALTSIGNSLFASGPSLNNTGGVSVSTNNGDTWTPTNLINAGFIYSLASSGTTLFASTLENGIYKSTNNGLNWVRKNEGLNHTPPMVSLLVNGNYIYAGTIEYSVFRRSINEIVGIQTITGNLPLRYSLKQNYPNPFNPVTKISYDLPNSNFVSLKVFDMNGKEIENLVNENQNAGSYSLTFNAANYPSGVYFYKLVTEGFSETKKMMVIK